MSAERVELVGGPLDGHTIAKGPGRFAWVAGRLMGEPEKTPTGPVLAFREGRGAARAPASGRALYRVVARGLAVYEGHRRFYCNGCGTYHTKVEGGTERLRCPLGGDAHA